MMLRELTATLRVRALAALLAALGAAVMLAGCDAERAGRTVRVGVYDNAPKVYVDDDGRPAGLFVALLKRIAAAEGWHIEPVRCGWADCLAQLETGSLDLMPDVAYSEERARRFDFHARSVTHDWSQVAVRPGAPITLMTDLAGKRVALLRGGLHQPTLDEQMRAAGLAYEVVGVDSLAEGYAAVAAGRADAAVANHFFAAWNNDRYGLIETPIAFRPVSLYFAARRGADAELLATIDRYLDDWRQDPDSPYYEALRRAMAPAAGELPAHVRYGLVTFVLVALLLGATVLALRWQVALRTSELETANQRLNRVLVSGPCVLYALRRSDGELVTEWISANIARLYGYSVTEAMQPGWWAQHVHPDDLERAQAAVDMLDGHSHVIHDYRIIDAVGNVRHVRDELRRADEGGQARYFGIWSDLTEIREQEAQIGFVTSHDLMTGLPNRALLGDRLAHAMQRTHRQAGWLALLFIDLDRFKHVNDSLGHGAGDQLLCEAAIRIGALLAEEDTFARVGGDEFAVLLEDAQPQQVSALAERIVGALGQPIELAGHPIVITASVGVALHPDDGADADTLIKHAELAMYEAKNAGRNTWRFFAPQFGEAASRRLLLESALRQASRRGELLLHYQPQYELGPDGRLVGLEALVRWQHAEQGLVPPALFIGIAEEIGIIDQIDAWVLDEACRQLAAWEGAGLYVPRVAVNLSALELASAGLVERVAAVLAAHGLTPDRLELEVTESVIMREPTLAERALAQLKALGVHLAVDDFGTGYSSLAYLKRLPIDRLKIDRSFVQDIGQSASDESIVRAVIALADSLGLETVAEGVEETAHADFLRAEGCRMAQGYLFARPLPADELAALLAGEAAAV